jgi:hypothetical protein
VRSAVDLLRLDTEAARMLKTLLEERHALMLARVFVARMYLQKIGLRDSRPAAVEMHDLVATDSRVGRLLLGHLEAIRSLSGLTTPLCAIDLAMEFVESSIATIVRDNTTVTP